MAKKGGNPQNFKKKTHEESVANGRKGGVASGISKRNAKDAKMMAQTILSLSALGKSEQTLAEMGIEENDRSNLACLMSRLFAQGMNGDLDATKMLMTYAGYEPSETRRDKEIDAKIAALKSNENIAVNMNDEDGENDVVVYLPQIEPIEDEYSNENKDDGSDCK